MLYHELQDGMYSVTSYFFAKVKCGDETAPPAGVALAPCCSDIQIKWQHSNVKSVTVCKYSLDKRFQCLCFSCTLGLLCIFKYMLLFLFTFRFWGSYQNTVCSPWSMVCPPTGWQDLMRHQSASCSTSCCCG